MMRQRREINFKKKRLFSSNNFSQKTRVRLNKLPGTEMAKSEREKSAGKKEGFRRP